MVMVVVAVVMVLVAMVKPGVDALVETPAGAPGVGQQRPVQRGGRRRLPRKVHFLL